jgi:ABC-2 type transport system ATP-binding protein
MSILIEARTLRKSFGPVVAVEQISFQIQAGEIYGLVGPDGAGKTTTLRLLCGAYPATAGEAFIAGIPIARQPDLAREKLGYLPQRFSLYEELTVWENLRFFARVRGIPAAEWQPRSQEILAFVGLETFINRRAGLLSGGMKQKLGLAVALVNRPQVLLLDEPTTGVDPVTRQDFWQLIIRLAVEEKIAVLVSTPYMDEASRCTRLGFMREGQLLIEGTPLELQSRLKDRIVALRGHPLPLIRNLAAADPAVETVQMFGDRLHLRLRPGMPATALKSLSEQIATQGGTVNELAPVPAQLEDVFLALLHVENTGEL